MVAPEKESSARPGKGRAPRPRLKDTRSGRQREVTRRTVQMKELRKLRRLPMLDDVVGGIERPRTRGECAGAMRPCPWVGCKFHLYLDVTPKGSIVLNFPDLEPWQLRTTCALDVAELGGLNWAETGAYVNLTRERIRQMEKTFGARPEVLEAFDKWRGRVAEAVAREK